MIPLPLKWKRSQDFKVLISNLNARVQMMNHSPSNLRNFQDYKVYKIKDQYSINQTIDIWKMIMMIHLV